jgi:hypothetical protein
MLNDIALNVVMLNAVAPLEDFLPMNVLALLVSSFTMKKSFTTLTPGKKIFLILEQFLKVFQVHIYLFVLS